MVFQNVLNSLDYGHAKRVSELSAQFAQHLNFSEQEIEHIRLGALYHDIGKVSVPASVLESPEPLTAKQQALIRQHVEYGTAILEACSGAEMAVARTIVATHHERWDGSGYPNGLKHSEIPLLGRIVALCDVFDALSSERPYKPAWHLGKVLDYIRTERGKAFDPNLANRFLEMIEQGEGAIAL